MSEVRLEIAEKLCAAESAGGELSEENLESVSGGNAATGLVLLLMRKYYITKARAIQWLRCSTESQIRRIIGV